MSSRRLGRLVTAAVASLVAVFASGCLTMEERLTINRDMSGRARLNMTMDVGAMMNIFAQQLGERSGGAPPGVDMAAMMQQEIKQELGDGLIDVEAAKKGLPAGVALANATQTFDDMKLTMAFDFQLSDMRKLSEIVLPTKEDILPAPGALGGPKTPMKPFDDFQIIDDGATILIATKPPAANSQTPADAATPASPPETSTMSETILKMQMMSMMSDILKGMKMSCAIESTMTVVESNSTTGNGALVWEMKIEDLMKQVQQGPSGLLPKSGFDIKARFKK